MTREPRRLFHEEPEFARLVEASREDLPTAGQIDAAVSIARRVAEAPRTPWWRSLVLGGAALVAVSVVVGTVARSSTPAAPSASVPPRIAPAEPASIAVATDDGEGRAPSVRPAPAPLPTISERPAPPTARAPSSKTPERRAEARPAAQSTFDEELRLLSEARAALERNDAGACLRAVEQYERRFPSKLFAEEMAVLRIEALARSGARARAHALATAFLEAHPGSPYAVQARSLAARTASPSPDASERP